VWKRFRRRSFGPRRPVLFPEQWPLAILTILTLVASIVLVLYVVFS
jgi:hypothetical protein